MTISNTSITMVTEEVQTLVTLDDGKTCFLMSGIIIDGDAVMEDIHPHFDQHEVFHKLPEALQNSICAWAYNEFNRAASEKQRQYLAEIGKAKKYDDLDEKIGKYYREPEDDDDDENYDESEGDLVTIGELAASHYGYL